MATFLKSELESLGVKVTMVELGKQMLDGEEVQLPPAILGEIGSDKSKKTVGLYAHYDVQPVRVFLATPSAPCGRHDLVCRPKRNAVTSQLSNNI
jgi:acetylornithine deacetylase/succinyl-diaminopimelate desuccinylase-like protein